jgi:lipopolysaccharide biosynthesis glycosyltransferase
MSERGVIYIVWGRDDATERALDRSCRSLKATHPELPVEVFRIEADDPIKALLQKSRMFELSPFRETLYLDADTIVLDRLDFAFLKAEEFGLACCICECPWARRYAGIMQGETVEYNTGVLFFCEQARSVFETWAQLAPQIDSSMIFLSSEDHQLRMLHNDQCSFAVAIEQTKFLPFVLPLNWNFRPRYQLSFFGPIKIWHAYEEPPPFFPELRKYYNEPKAIIQYHSALRKR